MPYGSICCTYHQLKYSSPNHSKELNKSHTIEPTLQKMEVYGKRSQENGLKAEKGKTERATGQKNKRGDLFVSLLNV